MAMKFFLFNIIMTPTLPPPVWFCFYDARRMFLLYIGCLLHNIYVCVCAFRVDFCNGLGVQPPPPPPRRAVWSSGEINPNCYSLEVSIAPDWFLIPADHPQCVRLIRPHELAGSISSGRGRNSSRPLLSATEGDGDSAELRSLTEWLNV